MARDRREYGDYEELGRRLEALEDALADFQTQVIDMWGFGGRETDLPHGSAYGVQVLHMVLTLQQLHQRLALEARAAIDESDVPEGKPRIPPPLDEKDPFGA